jgi:hypothetical protein
MITRAATRLWVLTRPAESSPNPHWPWTGPHGRSLSEEGGGPTGIVQGPGTLNPVGNGKLADVAGSITPGVVQNRSSARLPSARTVIDGGRRSWPLG